MGPFGPSEIIFIFILALVVFGPKKLPEIGRTLGKGMREFRKATDELKSTWEDHLRDSESPVHDLKQTFHDVKAELAASATEVKDEVEAHVSEITTDVEAHTSEVTSELEGQVGEITSEVEAHPSGVATDVQGSTNPEKEPALTAPDEETKPDAQAH